MTLKCIPYGCADEVRALGIEVIEGVHVNDHLPEAEGTPEGCQPMYARLAAYRLLGKCLWLDADQVVLKPLDALFSIVTDKPCAAVPSTPLHHQIEGENSNIPAIYSGLVVFTEQWATQRITEQCIELMNARNRAYRYRFADQSYISHVLRGNFHRLELEWQGFANRIQAPLPSDSRVAHWHGREKKPWTHPTMPNAALWREYA